MADLMPCPACGRNVMVDASRCKFCAADFRADEYREAVAAQRHGAAATTTAFSGAKTLAAAGATLALMGVFSMMVLLMADYRGLAWGGAALALAGASLLGVGMFKIAKSRSA